MSGLEVCSIFCKYGVHHLTISKHFNGKVTRCAFRIKIGLYFQKREVKPLIRELTQQNIAAIQKIINKGSVAEVKVEKGFIVVIEINRKKVN